MDIKIWRKSRIDLYTPLEKSIWKCIQKVEKLGASEKLTDAVIQLGKALENVSSYYDDILFENKTLKSDPPGQGQPPPPEED